MVRGVTEAANTGPERLVVAARAPGPAGAAGDGQMVVAECEDGSDDADKVTEEDVKGVVAEVPPARTGDENRGAEGYDGEAEKVKRRRGGLTADGGDSLVVSGDILVAKDRVEGGRGRDVAVNATGVAIRVAAVGELVGVWAGNFDARHASARGECGESRGIGETGRRKEGDRDGELARDEEGEVD